ncbi:gliding motility-associated C-terminal domain-containing protein [Cytophaga hutchinsonii]|uniref:Gliding motility-associated C-terminal domain-containing protein n=1 Tax=Cytophaga hutchinsonii (strain ATCC 33406 / DSM 1761 / CIP 103989 / NBRC 15051 / NCIMB 9469 / D465) TaxID=269798 RepID=A0A6N4SMZ1_CYTH3|nr:gliding motility-associated C-terminal domain-containing protein [Cytophaga hutchinsonii]ABG57635.1 hypothetical protein CHU_0345 [Cytophaga hutchinsonii ATCC 33406]SFX01630.1 C-terminal domain of CHU protein family protein [Cytophaga hutchinsonii ATCC 33406]
MKIISIIISFFIVSANLFAQHETDERILGFKYKLKFTNNTPLIVTENSNLYDPYNPNYRGNLQTPYANSICDTLGNVLFYYDGANIYEPNGQVMRNGTLHQYNFSSLYATSLIVPIEESNRRYYYLFETLPHEEMWDYVTNRPINDITSCYYPNKCFKFWDLCKLEYHIIDMHGNGGRGNVISKNIFLKDSVAPSISGIKHQNNIDTWVSVLGYRSNNILNYSVNSCEIKAPVVNTIPDFEYKENPLYIPYSPSAYTGYQLVYATKGDFGAFPGNKISDNPDPSFIPYYLFVAPFDNQTGKFNFSLMQTINVRSGVHAHLFSHDSKYLYCNDSHLLSFVWIYQYELSTGISTPLYYSNIPFDNSLSGTDYGKDNNILIYKYKARIQSGRAKYVSYLGEILHIDQPFLPGNLIDSLPIPAAEQPDYKPQYTYIARNNYIYNFYHPDYKKPDAFPVAHSVSNTITSPACFNQAVTLKGNTNIPADSMYWLIKKTSDTNWQRVNSDTFDITLSPGTYTASLVSYKYCLPDSATQQFTIEDYPAVRLADDTLYTCESKPVELPSTDTYSYYWYNENGETVSNQISATGKYNIVVQNSCGTGKDSLYLKNSLLEMTNLITANNDNLNDCMIATSNNKHETIQLSIYNSWGSCVFSENNYHNNWCPGNELSNGVYYYEARYNNACSKKGWIEIVR